jgi:aminopeptidase N
VDFWDRLSAAEERGDAFLGQAVRARAFDVDLLIDQPNHRISVTGTADCEVQEDGCRELRFLLGRNLARDDFAEVTVAKLQLDGRDVAWEQTGDCFAVAAPRPLAKGETFALSFQYTATPFARKCWVHSCAGSEEPGLGEGETELCYEGCWLPLFDKLLLPVTTDIRIRESLGQQAIFNGRLVVATQTADGLVHHFASVMPGMPTVIIGDFITKAVTHGGARVACYFQPGYERSVDIALTLAQQLVQLYTDWFGVSPGADATLVQLRRGPGLGQYAPSPLVAFPLQDLRPDTAYASPDSDAGEQTRRDLTAMLSHELGHFWFGGLVDYPSNHRWIGEGIATYLVQLVLERTAGGTLIPGMAERVAEIPLHEQAPLADVPLDHPHGSALAYGKAALALHVLRQELGDDQFLLLLRTVVTRLQHTVATTDDVEKIAWELFPDHGMEAFFDRHFRRVPEYVYDAEGSRLIAREPGA